MKVGSLCAGYGGIEMGLRLAGVPVDLCWLAEFESKLDPIHPVGVPNLGDLTAIDWTTVDLVDMVTAGFPCQPVSAAGAQQAQADPRWLWPAVRDCLAALRPERFLLENVRNLVSIQKGAIWAGILDDLTGLGYDVRWLTLGACHVGAAHHRHRVFALATKVPIFADRGAHRLDVSPCGAKSAKGGGDGTRAQQIRDRNSVTLDVVAALFPSPQARDGQGRGTPNLRTAVSLLPTPRASVDAVGGPGQRGSSGDLAMPSAVQPEHWGRFGLAVAQHAAHFGQPPAPTEPNRNGAPRLAAAFAEWLMCIPTGHVSGRLPRNAALKAIGNGVCPPQLAMAYSLLASLTHHSPPTANGATRVTKFSEQQEIEAIQRAARDLATAALTEHDLVLAQVQNFTAEAGRDSVVAALNSIVKSWRAQAVALEGSTKRGAVGRQKELRSAAGLLAAVAVDVAKLDLDAEPVSSTEAMIANATPAFTAPYPTLTDLAAQHPDAGQGASSTGVTFIDPTGGWSAPTDEARLAPLPGPDIPGSFGPGDVPLNPVGVLDLSAAGRIPLPDNQYTEAFKDAIVVTGHEAATLIDRASVAHNALLDDAAAYIGAGVPNAPQIMPDQREQVTYVTTSLTEPAMQPVAPVGLPMFIDPVARPVAPERLTYRDMTRLWEGIPDLDHKSYSQITSGEDCSMKVLLGRAARHGLIVGGQPQWANVGGTAFHLAAEILEREGPNMHGVDPVKLWESCFAATVKNTEAETKTSHENWRAANKGLEGYDWWRVQGADFVKAYAAYHGQAERFTRTQVVQIAQADGSPALALELPFQLDVDGVRLDGIIDKVEIDKTTGQLAVIDWKSGRFEPDSFQLSIYVHALARMWALPLERVEAGHWFARKGEYAPQIGVHLIHPWDEIVYRTHAQHVREQHRIATPRVSSFCHGCEHKLTCPSGPR